MMLALLAVIALLGYSLLCLASPTVTCPRRTVKRNGKRSRSVRCRKCKGKGSRRRPGARLVHGIFWAVAGDRMKAYFKDRYTEMTDPEGDGE